MASIVKQPNDQPVKVYRSKQKPEVYILDTIYFEQETALKLLKPFIRRSLGQGLQARIRMTVCYCGVGVQVTLRMAVLNQPEDHLIAPPGVTSPSPCKAALKLGVACKATISAGISMPA